MNYKLGRKNLRWIHLNSELFCNFPKTIDAPFYFSTSRHSNKIWSRSLSGKEVNFPTYPRISTKCTATFYGLQFKDSGIAGFYFDGPISEIQVPILKYPFIIVEDAAARLLSPTISKTKWRLYFLLCSRNKGYFPEVRIIVFRYINYKAIPILWYTISEEVSLDVAFRIGFETFMDHKFFINKNIQSYIPRCWIIVL